MAVLTFETLKFANHLKAAGIPSEHAEAQARALAEVLTLNFAELATKADLREVQDYLEGKLALMEQRIDDKLALMEQRLDDKLSLMEQRLDDKLILNNHNVDNKLASLEQRMIDKFALLEQRMTIKLGSMMVAAIGLAAALASLL